jgi:hypothetical protein
MVSIVLPEGKIGWINGRSWGRKWQHQ